jgi:hypothetical protein
MVASGRRTDQKCPEDDERGDEQRSVDGHPESGESRAWLLTPTGCAKNWYASFPVTSAVSTARLAIAKQTDAR